MKKILFISHDASLTGAPILLINLIELLRLKKSYELKVIIKIGSGPLLKEFNQLTDDLLIWDYTYPTTTVKKILNKVNPNLNYNKPSNRKIQKLIFDSDIIFSNTITNGDFLNCFKFKKSQKIITYVHELEAATKSFTNEANVNEVKKLTHHWLVPSNAVREFLIQNLQIPNDKIYNLNYYIPDIENKDLKNENKLNDKFYAGFAGTLDWRKGADLLPSILLTYFKKFPTSNLLFIWQGADLSSVEFKRIDYELKKINLRNKIIFNSIDKDMSKFYQSISTLILTSKEDPYPLVVLEAAKYAMPCICFENGGGAPEFVGFKNGDVIPYLDIDILTNKLHQYYLSPEDAKRKGLNALAHYKELHANTELILEQLSKFI